MAGVWIRKTCAMGSVKLKKTTRNSDSIGTRSDRVYTQRNRFQVGRRCRGKRKSIVAENK